MEWKIDTGSVGAVDAKDLRKVLEADRDHWLKTQQEAAGNLVYRILDPDLTLGAAEHEVLMATSKEAQAKFSDKAASVAEAMAAGIEAACKLAELYGGKVTATVSGHDDDEHVSGVDQRFFVGVDQRRRA